MQTYTKKNPLPLTILILFGTFFPRPFMFSQNPSHQKQEKEPVSKNKIVPRAHFLHKKNISSKRKKAELYLKIAAAALVVGGLLYGYNTTVKKSSSLPVTPAVSTALASQPAPQQTPPSHKPNSFQLLSIVPDTHIPALPTPIVSLASFSAPSSFSPQIEDITIPFSSKGTLTVGSYAAQGVRPSMEDTHVIIKDLNDLKAVDTRRRPCCAIFDGHGGFKAARYMEKYLAANIARFVGTKKSDGSPRTFAQALTDAFLVTDEHFLQKALENDMQDGCTGVLAAFENDVLYIANLGDSRAIICRNGAAVPLSRDHKPSDTTEMVRILNAGGFVTREDNDVPRVGGTLAVARAFGDAKYKSTYFKKKTLLPFKESSLTPAQKKYYQAIQKSSDSWVSAQPEIMQLELTQDDQFIVLACDGLWDVMSNEHVVKFVQHFLNKQIPISKICKYLVTYAITLRNSQDNVSVIIIKINH